MPVAAMQRLHRLPKRWLRRLAEQRRILPVSRGRRSDRPHTAPGPLRWSPSLSSHPRRPPLLPRSVFPPASCALSGCRPPSAVRCGTSLPTRRPTPSTPPPSPSSTATTGRWPGAVDGASRRCTERRRRWTPRLCSPSSPPPPLCCSSAPPGCSRRSRAAATAVGPLWRWRSAPPGTANDCRGRPPASHTTPPPSSGRGSRSAVAQTPLATPPSQSPSPASLRSRAASPSLLCEAELWCEWCDLWKGLRAAMDADGLSRGQRKASIGRC